MGDERREQLGRPLWLAYIVPSWAFSPEDMANLRANPPEIGGLVDDVESMAINICRAAFGNPCPPFEQVSSEAVGRVLERFGYENLARNHLMRVLRVRASFPGEWALLVNHLVIPAQSAPDTNRRATNMTTFATLLTRLFPTALQSGPLGRQFALEYFALATRWFQLDLQTLSSEAQSLAYSTFRAFLAGSFRPVIDQFVKYEEWAILPTAWKEKMLDFQVLEEVQRARGTETHLKVNFKLRRFNGNTIRDKVRSCQREIARQLEDIRSQQQEVDVQVRRVEQQAESSSTAARRGAPLSLAALRASRSERQQQSQSQPQPNASQQRSQSSTVPPTSSQVSQRSSRPRLDSPAEPPSTPAQVSRQQLSAVVVNNPPAPHLVDFRGLILKQSAIAFRSWEAILADTAKHNENLAASDQRSMLVIADIPYFVTTHYWDSVEFALHGSLPIPDALLAKDANTKFETFLRKHLAMLKKIGKGRNVMTFTCCSYAQAITLIRFLEAQQAAGWGDNNVTAFTMGTMRRVGECLLILVRIYSDYFLTGFLPGSYRAANRYTLIPNSEAFVQIVFGFPFNAWTGIFADRAGDLTVPWTGKQEYIYDDRRRAKNSTQKPLRLMVDMIRSLPNCDLVLDLYAGTGSASVAAALMEK